MTHRWANAAKTLVRRDSDGATIPADPKNADFAKLVADEVTIAAFQRFATLEAAKEGRLAELAHRRWLAEHDFSFGGTPLVLDDGTQRRIGAAVQYLALSEATQVRWQVSRGVFATFTAEQVQALAVAAGAHVQACFANVETLAGLIEAAVSIAAVEAVDLEQGWP